MEEWPAINLVPNTDLKMEDDFILNEVKSSLGEMSDFPKDKIEKAVADRMVYVALPIANNVKLLQESYALIGKLEETLEIPNKLRTKLKMVEKPNVTNKHTFPSSPLELDGPMICDVCDKVYKNNIAFALHSIQHSSDNKYSCHLCLYKNASKYHIEMHVRVHEGTTRYKCEVCFKAFTISTHATEHKYLHSGEKPFQCEICGKKFMFSWFLTSHRRTQHWELVTGKPLIKYDCSVCNKHYTSSTGLKRHNISHHGGKDVRDMVLCEICGKFLSSKEKFKFHTRIHTGYKPHSCTDCSKCFSKKEQLKEHTRVHTGERPYVCKVCYKGFTQRSPLRIHERLHTGERPYLCSICDKGFISKSVMDTHKKRCKLAKSLYEAEEIINFSERQQTIFIDENRIELDTNKVGLTDNTHKTKPQQNALKLDVK